MRLVEAAHLKVPVAQRSGIDQMEISQQNQDVQGDTSTSSARRLYEYLLGHLSKRGAHRPRRRAVRVEPLRGRMGESERQVEGLFESLLSESFA